MSYKSIIDSFDVENNPKYKPNPNATYCNIFAQDVMKKMGENLPSGNCQTMFKKLKNGYSHWKPVGALQAQNRAKAGYGTIGITAHYRDDKHINHVVVIYPTRETVTYRDDIHMSMAGGDCFNDYPITWAWESVDRDRIQYYSYFPNISETIVAIDTTTDVTKSNGETYIFETKSAQTPSIAVGTSGVVMLTHKSRDSRNGFDLWKLHYVGNSGAAAGIYTKGPGEKPLKRFVARVA